eukprot:scaffold105270_cov24-Phaeocystis_antarctica.AAC.1
MVIDGGRGTGRGGVAARGERGAEAAGRAARAAARHVQGARQWRRQRRTRRGRRRGRADVRRWRDGCGGNRSDCGDGGG